MRPFASKMTPDPVPVPWGSSATIVTTAGLTAFAMSTIEPWPVAGAGLATAGLTTGAGNADWWLPVALTARYVPPDDSAAAPMTAARTKAGPTVRFGLVPIGAEAGGCPNDPVLAGGVVSGAGCGVGAPADQVGAAAVQVGFDQVGGFGGGVVGWVEPVGAAQSLRGVSSVMISVPFRPGRRRRATFAGRGYRTRMWRRPMNDRRGNR